MFLSINRIDHKWLCALMQKEIQCHPALSAFSTTA